MEIQHRLLSWLALDDSTRSLVALTVDLHRTLHRWTTDGPRALTGGHCHVTLINELYFDFVAASWFTRRRRRRLRTLAARHRPPQHDQTGSETSALLARVTWWETRTCLRDDCQWRPVCARSVNVMTPTWSLRPTHTAALNSLSVCCPIGSLTHTVWCKVTEFGTIKH